jgi:EVE domain
MTYFLNLFTPETWAAFRNHGCNVSGFRERQRKKAEEHIKPGDTFLCYLVRLSRWCGALEVTSKVFLDSTPLFSDPDPFVVRFNVRPVVALDPERSLPMLDEALWQRLSITREIPFGKPAWGMAFRGSLREIADHDGSVILALPAIR